MSVGMKEQLVDRVADRVTDRVTNGVGQVTGPLRVVRLRVFAILLAAIIAVFGLVSLAAWPVWPVVGVTLAAVAFAVNAVTTPLAKSACWNCGHDLEGVAPGTYGMTCPDCGSIHGGLRTAEAPADLYDAELGEPLEWDELPEPGVSKNA